MGRQAKVQDSHQKQNQKQAYKFFFKPTHSTVDPPRKALGSVDTNRSSAVVNSVSDSNKSESKKRTIEAVSGVDCPVDNDTPNISAVDPPIASISPLSDVYPSSFVPIPDGVLLAHIAEQDLSATSNSASSFQMFAEKEYSEMLCDDPACADSTVVDEEFKETFDSENNSNPDFSAASSSSTDASEPVAKKVKVDLPHTRQHLGKSYLLSYYGLKNFKKLVDNKQLERGVKSKPCYECSLPMDWQVDGPIKKVKGTFYYTGRHNGACVKKGQDGPRLAYDKEFKEINSKLIVLKALKDKTKADLDNIATLTARRAICFQKGINSRSQNAAKDARAAGMCPGAFDIGCPTKSPQVPGRSYCKPCQVKDSQCQTRISRSSCARQRKESGEIARH